MLSGVVGLAVAGCSLVRIEAGTGRQARIATAGESLSWSQAPPGAQGVADVPQFVSITSDDNFGDEAVYAKANDMLLGSRGLGATQADIGGFRTPFLGYNDATFSALARVGYQYDSSIPNCFGAGENGSDCSWPYTLDEGSPDADDQNASTTSARRKQEPSRRLAA